MKMNYKTQGVCSTDIDLEIEDGIIKHVEFYRGCNGNLQAISVLVTGMDAMEAVKKLEGISCGGRGTSCGDQLARAIKSMI